MGLAERRVIKSFQENEYQKFLAEVKEVVGKDVEVDVQWDSLAEDGMSHMYEEAWVKVYFEPVKDALKSICSDDMGKEAINESLGKIVIKNEADIHYAGKWSSFEGNVLTLDHKPITNIDYIKDRSDALQKMLEDNL